jgi:hypothetical protein
LSTPEFARTAGKRGGAEDEHVLVRDQVPGLAAAASLAEVVQLEERGSKVAVSHLHTKQQRLMAHLLSWLLGLDESAQCLNVLPVFVPPRLAVAQGWELLLHGKHACRAHRRHAHGPWNGITLLRDQAR